MENMHIIKVKKSVSPLAYVGIIMLVLIFAFVSMLVVFNLMKERDSYKTAELRYFAGAAEYIAEQTGTEQTLEYEFDFSLNTDSDLISGMILEELNSSVFKGVMTGNGTNFDMSLEYLNGDTKVMSTAMWLNENVLTIILPEMTDVMMVCAADAETVAGTAELDYAALTETMSKIVGKYFELVGEPEIIEKKHTITQNGISADCVWYRIDMDAGFLKELLEYSMDVILENDNLVDCIGREIVERAFKEAKEGMSGANSNNGSYIRMDVFASDNIIIKRSFEIINNGKSEGTVSIVGLEDENSGYFSVEISGSEENLTFVNRYTKTDGKMNGEMSLSSSDEYLIGGDIFTLAYTDIVFDETYGYVGKFQVSAPSLLIDIVGSGELNDGYSFNYGLDYGGQRVCNLSGRLKLYDGYNPIEKPADGEYKELFIDAMDETGEYYKSEEYKEFAEDLTKYLTEIYPLNYADENGKTDIIGYILSPLLAEAINDMLTSEIIADMENLL